MISRYKLMFNVWFTQWQF